MFCDPEAVFNLASSHGKFMLRLATIPIRWFCLNPNKVF